MNLETFVGMNGSLTNKKVFLCSISPEDLKTAIELGIYGNRFFYNKKGEKLSDTSKLSIIRDLVALSPGDLILLHTINEQKIYGIFEVTSKPFFSEQEIWNSQTNELYPCRFCFQPLSSIKNIITKHGIPYITVHELYEIIELFKIKSLISVEYEKNIERRSVRKLLWEDAIKIIKYFISNFRIDATITLTNNKINNNICEDSNSLEKRIFKVGNIENAVKAIILYELANKKDFFSILFPQNENLLFYDFVHEVFISPILRKLMDIYVIAKLNNNIEKHIVIEVKTNEIDFKDLKQGLTYLDLLIPLNWCSINAERELILIGKQFKREVKKYVKIINSLFTTFKIRLIKYIPNENGKWAIFQEESE